MDEIEDILKWKHTIHWAVHLGKNVRIASNVTILPGVHIGDNSIIVACSVVTKDIPPNVIAYGNPLKLHREITVEGEYYICAFEGDVEMSLWQITSDKEEMK